MKSFKVDKSSKVDVSYLHKSNMSHHTGIMHNKIKNWVDTSYRNKKIPQKLWNKKYPQFTYDELFNQHE